MILALATRRETLTPMDCKELVLCTPLDRLESVVGTSDDFHTVHQLLLDDYAWFLSTTGQLREHLLAWIAEKPNRDDAFTRARNFGSNIYRLLTLVADEETLRYLVI